MEEEQIKDSALSLQAQLLEKLMTENDALSRKVDILRQFIRDGRYATCNNCDNLETENERCRACYYSRAGTSRQWDIRQEEK